MDFYDRFWSALGYKPVCTGLKTLEEKALIVVHKHRYSEAIDEDIDGGDHSGQYFCEFSMRELVRDMGRRIVVEESEKDPAKRSRVWREEDTRTMMASTIIQENSNVEGLMWRRRMELQHIDTLAPMHKLVFLMCWKLQLMSGIESLPTNLRYLVLSQCQLKDNNPQMAVKETSGDRNGSSVRSAVLPKSIAQLIHLRYLDMSGTKQTCLPKEVCELHCLEELYLSRCSLEALPEDFGNLIKLKTLDVSNNFLLEFPPSFKHLQSLRNLDMSWNEQLVAFPAFPNNLIALSARRCSKLQVISLHSMRSLETIDLSHCKSVTRLPELQSCKSLRNLNLDGCKQLFKLDTLPQRLASLRISGGSQLQDFPSIIRQRRDVVPAFRRSRLFGARTESFGENEMQSLCMIGCDRIRLNIYRLLENLPYLEQLDLSLSPEEEVISDPQPLVGQKNLAVQKNTSCESVIVFFVLESNDNVRHPEMDVSMTFFDEGGEQGYSQTFRLPSRMIGNFSGGFIMRICNSSKTYFFERGMICCSYSVQRGSPVLLRQVEVIRLSEYVVSSKVTRFMKKWKLLTPSKVAVEEGNAIDCRHSML